MEDPKLQLIVDAAIQLLSDAENYATWHGLDDFSELDEDALELLVAHGSFRVRDQKVRATTEGRVHAKLLQTHPTSHASAIGVVLWDLGQKVDSQSDEPHSAELPPSSSGYEPEQIDEPNAGSLPNLVPAKKRTRQMSKAEAVKFMNRRGNPDANVRWLSGMIDSGDIRYQKVNRSKGYFHLDDFPADRHDELRP